MMKDVLQISPRTKREGLAEFAAQGFLLIDATYAPVNHAQLSPRQRNKLILDEFPLFLDDLRIHAKPDTKLILVKANICELLEPMLAHSGFTVLNRGQKIPFPSTGHQNKFRDMVRPLFKLNQVFPRQGASN